MTLAANRSRCVLYLLGKAVPARRTWFSKFSKNALACRRPGVLVYYYIVTHEAAAMLFTIHSDGSVPIYEQIVAQVIYGVAAGTLQPGALIPSVRELAETLLVHPNTVARA